MLAAEPVRIEIHLKYDHRTQTSTFDASVPDQVKVQYTNTSVATTRTVNGKTITGTDGDSDN